MTGSDPQTKFPVIQKTTRACLTVTVVTPTAVLYNCFVANGRTKGGRIPTIKKFIPSMTFANNLYNIG